MIIQKAQTITSSKTMSVFHQLFMRDSSVTISQHVFPMSMHQAIEKKKSLIHTEYDSFYIMAIKVLVIE